MTWGDRLTRSPELYPLAIDAQSDAVRFVTLSRADYSAASFLDRRMPQAATGGEWKPWAEVSAATAGLSPRCHFVFHISHVGSTLVARLVDRHPGLFALREPAILRGLGEVYPVLTEPAHRVEFDRRLGVYLGTLVADV